MAKRFTSTEVWDEDWFQEMPNEYKLFWFYMLSKCDHAGLFKVNLRSFCGQIGVNIEAEKAITMFNFEKQRIRIISERLWFVEDFFVYQYGTTFNWNNRVHESIGNVYLRNNIELTSIRGLKDLKDRAKDKDKDKDNKYSKTKKTLPKAVKITDEVAVFEDGSQQELGESQLYEHQQGRLSARQVVKGHVY